MKNLWIIVGLITWAPYLPSKAAEITKDPTSSDSSDVFDLRSTLSKEQLQKKTVENLSSENELKLFAQQKNILQQRIQKLRNELSTLFMAPTPDRAQILGKQDVINALQTQLDTIASQLPFSVRKSMDRDRVETLLYGKPGDLFPGTTLTQEQDSQMQDILKEYVEFVLNNRTRLKNLKYEISFLTKSPTVNESQVLQKIAEMGNLSNSLDQENFKALCKLRQILTWEQKELLYDNHRMDLLQKVGLTKEQEKRLVEIHKQIDDLEIATNLQLNGLQTGLLKAYSQIPIDEATSSQIQSEISALRGEAAKKELSLVCDVREVLTPEQRNKLIELRRTEESQSISANK